MPTRWKRLRQARIVRRRIFPVFDAALGQGIRHTFKCLELENWTTVATITTGSETETVDVPAPGSGSKFYRAVLAP